MSKEDINTAAEFFQASVMVLSGRPTKTVDVLFFHNRSFGDYTDLFEMAGEIFRKGSVRFVTVTNNEGERFGSTIPFEANPGMTECIRCLTEEQQIPSENILVPKTKAFHTRQENNTFLELSRQNSWRSGVILTQPHQLLRAMLGMVQAMGKEGYQMEVYTAAPPSTPWQEIVKGNQGVDLKPRVEYIADELERIYRYQASGELATLDELFEYLKAREGGSLILGSVERGSERLRNDLPPHNQAGLT